MRRSPKKAVNILLPLPLYEQIKMQSDVTHRTVSSYVRQVLRRYLWHVENAPEALVDEWEIR
ncbi:hypothetical protein N510_002448 [Firmicutes bacterium ASF500]|nr:hypothetical protein N510_002448 [Firmicutes bacterium ASF500]